jgi:hypothetical protein
MNKENLQCNACSCDKLNQLKNEIYEISFLELSSNSDPVKVKDFMDNIKKFMVDIKKLSVDDLKLLLSFSIEYLSVQLTTNIISVINYKEPNTSLSSKYKFCVTTRLNSINVSLLSPLQYLVVNNDNIYNVEKSVQLLPENGKKNINNVSDIIGNVYQAKHNMMEYLSNNTSRNVFNERLPNSLTPLQTVFQNGYIINSYMNEGYTQILSMYTDGNSEINDSLDKVNPYVVNILSASGFQSAIHKLVSLSCLILTGAYYDLSIYNYINLNFSKQDTQERKKLLDSIVFSSNKFPSNNISDYNYQDVHANIILEYLQMVMLFYNINDIFINKKVKSTDLFVMNYSIKLRNSLQSLITTLDNKYLLEIVGLFKELLTNNLQIISKEEDKQRITGLIYITNFYILKLGNLFTTFSQEQFNFIMKEEDQNLISTLEVRFKEQIKSLYKHEDIDPVIQRIKENDIRLKEEEEIPELIASSLTTYIANFKQEIVELDSLLVNINKNIKMFTSKFTSTSTHQSVFSQKVLDYRNNIDHCIKYLPEFLEKYKTYLKNNEKTNREFNIRKLAEIENLKKNPRQNVSTKEVHMQSTNNHTLNDHNPKFLPSGQHID